MNVGNEVGAAAPQRPNGAERTYYENPALWASAEEDIGERERERLRQTAARLPGDGAIADVGAGDGRLLRVLREVRPSTALRVAVDRSAAALAQADGARVLADASSLPFRDGAFHTVTSCEMLEHLPEHTYVRALAELRRVAARQIVLTVPYRENLRRGDVRCLRCRCTFHRHRHLRSFSERSVRELFPGFILGYTELIGPRRVHAPRHLLRLGRRLGLLPPPGGAPLCPQCGERLGEETERGAATTGAPQKEKSRAAHSRLTARAAAAGVERLLAARIGRPPWMLATFNVLAMQNGSDGRS